MRVRAALRISVLIAAILVANAGHAEPRRAVTSMLEMRHEGVVLQQWDLSCGAAALATLLAIQHNDAVSERDVALTLMRRTEYLANPELIRAREGFSLLDLKRFVQARGYQGVGFGQLRLEDIAHNAPLITPLAINGYNHFVVVRGVREGRVEIADPAFGNRKMSVAAFERVWLADPRMGHVGFVVLRGDARLARQP